MSILDTFNLSYSTYSLFKESPLVFYFTKIAKAEPTDWTPDVYGKIGNIVHSALENRINNKDFSCEDYFIEQWYKQKIETLSGIYGSKPKQEKYLQILRRGVKYVDLLLDNYDKVIAEERFDFEFNGIHVKGFIDVIAIKNNVVYLFDWKTDSDNNYEKHKKQRLFYSWAYYKIYEKVVDTAKWIYLSKGETQQDSFSLTDLLKFEKELKKDIDLIKKWGNDINNYPIGDIDSPFNAYKTLCENERERRNNNTLTIIFRADKCKIKEPLHSDLNKLLSKKLSYEKKDAVFIRKNSNWDGIVRLYSEKTQTFPTGLLSDVIGIIREYDSNIKVVYENIIQKTDDLKFTEQLKNIQLRDYQLEAVDTFQRKRRGIIKMFTGMGKTITATEIIRRVGKKTLWIINRKLLAEQTQKNISETLGVEVGLISEGNIDIKDVTVATYQTLTSKKEQLKDYFKTLGFVVVDEVHGASAKSVKEILKYCINTTYRLGLSATPDLKEDWLEVKGLIGPIVYELKDESVKKSFLTNAEIIFYRLDDEKYSIKADYADSYNNYIVYNDIRNDKIIELVKKHNNKILVMTKSLEHAKLLFDKIKSEGLDVALLIGDTDRKQRDEIVYKLNNNDSFVVVATYSIVSEGWDVPALNVVINATALSSDIRAIQSLGRVLRKSDNKRIAYYYDFIDYNVYYFRLASKSRVDALKQENNKINIL